MGDGLSADERAELHVVLHELWLRIHVRRFDGFGDDPRPDHVSPTRAVDCFYAGVLKSQHIVETFAREHGIDQVYDRPDEPLSTRLMRQQMADGFQGEPVVGAAPEEPTP